MARSKPIISITGTQSQKKYAKCVLSASEDSNMSRMILRLITEYGNNLGVPDDDVESLPEHGENLKNK